MVACPQKDEEEEGCLGHSTGQAPRCPNIGGAEAIWPGRFVRGNGELQRGPFHGDLGPQHRARLFSGHRKLDLLLGHAFLNFYA